MKRVTTWRCPRRDPNIPLDRKKVYFFVGGVVLASLIIAVVVIFFVDPVPPLREEEKVMLQSYDELRGDLVRDDLNAARTKAQAIVRVSGDWKDVVVPARAIACALVRAALRSSLTRSPRSSS